MSRAGRETVVHRCRFVEYQPSPINAIAPHTNRPDGAAIKLAVSRGNGNIEIWNVASDWHMERVLPGGGDTSVEAVVWDSGRLFAAGLHSVITEWSVDTLSVAATADSYGGSVWCLAVSTASDALAAGCEDGCIKLYDLSGGVGSVEFVRTFDKQDGRVLSLDWHDSDSTLVSGGSDGTARLWNTANGRCKFRVTMQGDGREGGTLVWAVKVLSDGTLVTGDSHGRTQFWDGKYGTLLQTFRQHEADVLGLAVSDDWETVYATGVDNKVIQIKRVQTETTDSWVVAGRARDHSHDVRACVLTPNGLLVTGGVDTSLIVYSAAVFGRPGASHRKLPPFPHRPVLSLAKGGLMLYRDTAALQLWRLGSPETPPAATAAMEAVTAAPASDGTTRRVLPVGESPKLLLELGARDGQNMICSAISGDGNVVAYSTIAGTRLFRVAISATSRGGVRCHVERVRGLSGHLGVAHAMEFVGDTSLLVVATTSRELQVVDLSGPTVLATVAIGGDEAAAGSNACLLAVSSDAQWAAVAYGPEVHLVGLDTLSHDASTTAFASPPSAMAFLPGASEVVVVCADNRVATVDAESGLLTEWSKRHSAALPKQWLARKEKVVSIAFDPAAPSPTAYLHDHSGFTVLDFAQPLPGVKARLAEVGTTIAAVVQEQRKGKGRRKSDTAARSRPKTAAAAAPATDSPPAPKRLRAGPDADGELPAPGADNLKVVKKYQPLLFMGCSDARTLVVVERPWLAVMQNLPPPLYRAKYGAV